jgi:hypothetical protein
MMIVTKWNEGCREAHFNGSGYLAVYVGQCRQAALNITIEILLLSSNSGPRPRVGLLYRMRSGIPGCTTPTICLRVTRKSLAGLAMHALVVVACTRFDNSVSKRGIINYCGHQHGLSWMHHTCRRRLH